MHHGHRPSENKGGLHAGFESKKQGTSHKPTAFTKRTVFKLHGKDLGKREDLTCSDLHSSYPAQLRDASRDFDAASARRIGRITARVRRANSI